MIAAHILLYFGTHISDTINSMSVPTYKENVLNTALGHALSYGEKGTLQKCTEHDRIQNSTVSLHLFVRFMTMGHFNKCTYSYFYNSVFIK